MVAWEGRFSWQEYALTGRPDFLNYLHTGDVTWDELWTFYRQHPAAALAVRAVMRLFHAFQSSEFDSAGCWLDPEGQIYSRLRAWAEFTHDAADRIPIAAVQADLAGLVGAGLVTRLYYQAAYLVWMETSVDRGAKDWSHGEAVAREVGGSTLEDGLELPMAEARHLPVYHPGASRFPELQGDSDWERALQELVASRYHSWNSAYAAALPDPEEEEAWTTVGGEA